MNYKFPDEINMVFNKFSKKNFQIFLVGGAVRDLLLKKEIKDWDFTTDAVPDEILNIFPEGFYNNQFGTVGIPLSLGVVEITTMRKEGTYSDSRHPTSISWTKEITEDLGRRDFTINAMAMDLNGKVTDPFNGRGDLEKKIIKTVGEAIKRFSEDALRILRAIRFATELDFKIDLETFKVISKKKSDILEISWERIRDEFFKILGSPNPYNGLTLLKESGLLEVILPEVQESFGIKQEGEKHDRIYDIGDHSFRSLKFCPSKDPIVRFACLIHDVGKVDTYKVDELGNATFYGHDIIGAKIAKKICLRFKLSNKDSNLVVKLVRYHLFTVDEKQTDSAIRRFVRNVGLENLEDMFSLREADRLGGASNPTSWRLDHFKERIKKVLEKPFSLSDVKVNGKDVMDVLKIPPSRKVGEVLDKLFEEVLEDASKNNRDYLLDRIKNL